MTIKVGKAVAAVLLIVPTVIPRMTAQEQAQPASSPAPASPSPTPAPQPQAPQKSLADFAREQRENQNGGAPETAPAPQPSAHKSLGELAKERATKRRSEVKINESDSRKLFSEMDEIMGFASRDSGLPRRTAVKHQLVGEDEVNRHTAAALSDLAETQRLARSEIVMKKFGFLPRDFNLHNYLATASTQSLGGFYEPKTKTMNLVNWVGLEEQRPIMAHELTHALQDQNYDLMTWAHFTPRAGSMHVTAEDAVEGNARRAVIEGQAMIVFFDYLLKPYGRTLANTPGAQAYIKETMTSTYDTSVIVRNAPRLLRDTAIFPYREGLMFELELLRKGGQDLTFAGAFVRPPSNTHEILEPGAYLRDEKSPSLFIPDLSAVLAGNYEPYDSGTVGQLDARILAEELGSENDMFTIAPNWLGGAYVAVARKSAGGNQAKPASTGDIALLYVSRWKTEEAAQRLLEIYQKSLGKRVAVIDVKPWLPAACSSTAACAGHQAVRVNTSEGPVFLELFTSDTVFIAQGFSEETANGLRQIVLHRPSGGAKAAGVDLSLRLLDVPAFHAFGEVVGRELIEAISTQHAAFF